MAEVKDNILEINKVYKELNLTINENIKYLEKGATAVEKYNKVISIKPSDYSKGIDEINTKTKQLEQSQKNLETQTNRLSQAKKQNNVRTSEEIVNQRALAQNTDLVTKSNSKLVGAYQRLNAQHQLASKRLRDLIASQTASNNEIRKAQREFDILDKRIKKADNAVKNFTRNVGNYKSAFSGLSSLMGAFGVAGGLTLFASLVTDTIRLIKELQGLNMALQQVSGTAQQFAINQNFIKTTSDNLGIGINDLTKQFTQFYVSAKDKLSQNQIEEIFTSIAKAGATMGLSVDAQNRAFTALNQSMAKGQVMSEELKGQLSEALPGALGIMAKSLNVTEKELMKMMEAGEVSSKAWIGFAKQVEKTYGIENITNVKTLTAETTRLNNAWVSFIASMDTGNGVISKFMMNALGGLTKIITVLERYNETTKTEVKRRVNDFVNATREQITGTENEKVKQYRSEVKRIDKILEEQLKSYEKIKEKEKEQKNSIFATGTIMQSKIEKTIAERKEIEKNIAISKSAKNSFIKDINDIQNARKNVKDEFVEKAMQVHPNAKENNLLAFAQTKSTEYLRKEIESFNKVQEEKNKKEKENNKTQKTSIDLKKEEREIVDGSVEYYEKLIAQLKEQQTQQATTNGEYNGYNIVIDLMVKKLDALIGKKKELAKLESDPMTSISISDEDLLNDMYMVEEEFFNFAERMKAKGIDLMSNFASNTGFTTTFQILNKQIEGFGENWLITTDAILTASTEMFNFLNSMGEENFQAEYDRENRRKENSLKFAGDSAEAKAEIEKESERRMREIKRREAQAQKKQAIFQASIDMVKGIMGAIASNPVTLGMPQAAIIGALGLANIARINSQQIPEFWKGTENAPEGLAWTNERGREIITDAKGKIKDYGTDKGATLKYLNKGDKVLKHSDTMRELDNILMQNNISKPLNNNINIDLLPLQNDIKNLTNIIANKSEITIVKDMQGERYYNRVNGQRQELKNTILNLKTRNV